MNRVSSMLTDANLTGAKLSAHLANAYLGGANLRNVCASGANWLSSAIFSPETVYNQWTQFPSDFNPVAAGLTFIESPAGDFDGNDLLDVSDVDMLIGDDSLGRVVSVCGCHRTCST